MSKEIFLIDANSLITPHLTYYPFDFAESFWSQMEEHIQNGDIAILDLVKDEILQGEDSLKDWMEALTISNYIDRRDPTILAHYGAILGHIQSNACYKPSALAEWAKGTVADPWLISVAKAKGYTIITFEVPNKGLNSRSPSKNAKIPDVANVFGVKTENLFYMMRALGFTL